MNPLLKFLKKQRPILVWSLLFILVAGLIVMRLLQQPQKLITYRIARDVQLTRSNVMNKAQAIAAFSDDLMVAIAQQQGFSLKLLTENTDRLMLNLENGLVDGILASFEPNFRARDLFSFSDPYFLIGPVLIIPKTSPLNMNLELKDKIIGVPANSSSFFDMQGNTSIQLRLYNDILPALKDLDEGRIDGVIFPALTAYIFTSTFYPQHFSIATSPLTQEGLRLIALKNEHGNHLIEQFNAGLLSLKEKGIYTQLLTKWGLIQLDH